MGYRKAKYRFQWWWYSEGGKETVEAATGTLMLFGCLYAEASNDARYASRR